MATFTKRVNASSDDGYRDPSFGTPWDYTGNSIKTGNESIPTRSMTSAVRFTSVSISQGASITSAYLKLTCNWTDSNNVLTKVYGIDEDNTATFTSDPTGRSKTTAAIDWDINTVTNNTVYTSPNIASIVQEIVDRGSWSSGNAMGFLIENDGSSSGSTHFFDAYDGSSSDAAYLEITYVGSSPSSSQSPSSSPSLSPSSSVSQSPSSSNSPSPSPDIPFTGLRVAKTGYNVLLERDPNNLNFSSEYSTLKYFTKTTVNVDIDANAGDIAGEGTYTHNLGYYPFVEVYVRVYIGSPSGNYEYCPFYGAGATVLYSANYKITTTQVKVQALIDGVSTSTWDFDFLIFVYKNNISTS